MAVKLLRILGLCTPWRRIAHDGNVDRVRSILSQVMRGSFAQQGRWMARQRLQLLTAQLCAGDAAPGKQCDCDADIPSRPARYLSLPSPPAACGPDPRSRRMDGGDAVVQSSGAQTVGIQCIGRSFAVALALQCLPHQRPSPRPPLFVLLPISDVCCLPLCCKHGVSPLSLYMNGPFNTDSPTITTTIHPCTRFSRLSTIGDQSPRIQYFVAEMCHFTCGADLGVGWASD
jgi:hypothetical protein